MSSHTTLYRVTANRLDRIAQESWAYLDQSRTEYQRDWAEANPVFKDVTLHLEMLDSTHFDVNEEPRGCFDGVEVCAHEGCEETEIAGEIHGKRYCETCFEGWSEYYAEQGGPDPHGDRDPTPEEQAGWAMQDKIDMYRNEY